MSRKKRQQSNKLPEPKVDDDNNLMNIIELVDKKCLETFG